MNLPAGVVAALSGNTEQDRWEAVLHLLTVDGDGWPRVCLLSRAEVDPVPDGVRCVLRSRRTAANLSRDGRALLVVVHDVSAYYLRLALVRTLADDRSGALAVEFTVEQLEEDSRSTPLRPMTFLAGAEVRQAERADASDALLRRLSAGDPGT